MGAAVATEFCRLAGGVARGVAVATTLCRATGGVAGGVVVATTLCRGAGAETAIGAVGACVGMLRGVTAGC